MDIFKRFSEEKLPDKECFYSSVKDGTTDDNSEQFDGHISDKDYLTCKKIWNEFNMKNLGGLSWSLFEKIYFAISWCFWKVYWHVPKILRAWSLSFYWFSWIELGCHVKNDWYEIKKNCGHCHVLIVKLL